MLIRSENLEGAKSPKLAITNLSFDKKQEFKLPIPLKYYDKEYKVDHWARHLPTMADKNFIATLKINDVLIGLKLNGTDARGYRGIACLVTKDESEMPLTFNRHFKVEEQLALSTALTIFAHAYENFGMIAQTSIAGNNSQSVSPDGSVQIGNEKEPCLLHGHIIGRGNPDTCYIGNVPLRGPKAGAEMNLRGDGKDAGNTTKVKWNDEELEIVSQRVGSEVAKILESTPSLKGIEIISIRRGEKKKETIKRSSNYGKWLTGALAVAGIGIFAFRLGQTGNTMQGSFPKPKL